MDPTVNQRLFKRESANFNLIRLQATMRVRHGHWHHFRGGFDKLIRKTFENLTRNSNAMLSIVAAPKSY